jgi:hypothetical protein
VVFARSAPFGEGPAERGSTHRHLLSGGQTRAEFLKGRLGGGVHPGRERLKASGLELGWIAAPLRLRGAVTGGAIAAEEIADTPEAEPEACGPLPHRAFVALIRSHHSEAYISGRGSQRQLL